MCCTASLPRLISSIAKFRAYLARPPSLRCQPTYKVIPAHLSGIESLLQTSSWQSLIAAWDVSLTIRVKTWQSWRPISLLQVRARRLPVDYIHAKRIINEELKKEFLTILQEKTDVRGLEWAPSRLRAKPAPRITYFNCAIVNKSDIILSNSSLSHIFHKTRRLCYCGTMDIMIVIYKNKLWKLWLQRQIHDYD